MNLVLHGVSDFRYRGSGNVAAAIPSLIEGDRLKAFDVILANPPYSIKKWNREAWQSDKWGRNFLGTPPQGRADYAFFQHILKSMDPQDGSLRHPVSRMGYSSGTKKRKCEQALSRA